MKNKKKGEKIVLCRRNGNGKKKWSLEDAKNKSNEMRSWKGKKVVEGQYKTLGKSRATPRPSNPMADNGHKKGCTLARTMRVAHGSRSTHTNLLQAGKQRIKRLKPIDRTLTGFNPAMVLMVRMERALRHAEKTGGPRCCCLPDPRLRLDAAHIRAGHRGRAR